MKKRLFALLFPGILLVFGFLHLILPDQAVSHTERRALAQFPKGGFASVLDGVFMENMEKYLPDQFPFREGFRSVKAGFERLSGRLDSNDIYNVDGWLASLEFGYDDKAIEKTAEKLNQLRTMFDGIPAAVISVIPPKNLYMHDRIHPVPDYHHLTRTLTGSLNDYGYCEISDTLNLASYYKTDSHWRQETLDPTAEKLCAALGVNYVTEEYSEHAIEDFFGVYAGQSALPVSPEAILYRTSPSILSASVSAVGSEIRTVYTPEAIGLDTYDLFLGGAVPVITIVNESADGNLLIVRDSFGSSLIPLLIPSFHTITAVDLRYISSDYLSQYLTAEYDSLLVLLSAGIINNSEMLKIR